MENDSLIQQLIDSVLSVHQFHEKTIEKTGDEFNYMEVFVFLIPFWFALIYFAYNRWKIRKWRDGIFPQELPYSKQNLTEAYICLTAYFITIDKFHQMRKIVYLKSFFLRNFKYVPEKFDDIIDRNFHYPIHPISVADWINKYAHEKQKQQLIQFLVELCHIDGTLKQKEHDSLKVLTRKFRLDSSFLESCIFNVRGERNQRAQENSRTSTNGRIENEKTKSISLRKKYAEILGVSENATEIEIKKRYRQLVKLYHPDKYARDSKEQQEQAHQRFLEIQEAYEYLVT